MPDLDPQSLIQALSEPEQAQLAREAAARRMRQSAQPPGGRQEGGFTDLVSDPRNLWNMTPPGMLHNLYKTAGENPSVAGIAAASLPAAKGLGMLMRAAPKTAALGAGALGALAPATAGEVPLPQPNPIRAQANQDLDLAQKGRLNEIEAMRARGENELAIKMAEKRAQEEFEREKVSQKAVLPFREKYPDIAKALFTSGVAGSFLLPYAMRMGGRFSQNMATKAFENAVERVGKNPTATGINELKAYQKGMVLPGSDGVGAKSLASSATAPAIDSFVPIAHDMSYLPEGDKNREAAWKAVTDPKELAGRIVSGLMLGTPAAVLGNKTPIPYPTRMPPIAASQGLIDTFRNQAAAATRAANKTSKPRRSKSTEE